MALGQAKISMFLAMNRKLILLLPLALILPRVGGLGVWGLLLAEPGKRFPGLLHHLRHLPLAQQKASAQTAIGLKRVEKLVHSGKNV